MFARDIFYPSKNRKEKKEDDFSLYSSTDTDESSAESSVSTNLDEPDFTLEEKPKADLGSGEEKLQNGADSHSIKIDDDLIVVEDNKDTQIESQLSGACPTGPGNLLKEKHALLCFPFPPMSVTLVVGPSNCGKSEIVKALIENQQYFYDKPLSRVIFVMCNPRAKVKLPEQEYSPRPLPTMETTSIDNFDPQILREGDLVIFEDLSIVTETVRSVLNVLAHHLRLAGVFVIVQGLVGTKRYELVHYCHKAIFFVKQRTGISNLDFIIRGSASVDKNTKEYVRSIAAYCQKMETPLLIEINPLEGISMPRQMAVSHLKDLLHRDVAVQEDPGPSSKNFAVVHPYLHTVDSYTNSVHPETLVREVAASNMPKQEYLPLYSYVLVPAQFAVSPDSDPDDVDGDNSDGGNHEGSESDTSRKRRKPSNQTSGGKRRRTQTREIGNTKRASACLDPKFWNKAMANMEESIERSFDRKQWLHAKNICREIIESNKFCITSDMKTVHIKESSKNSVPILDFVHSCIRRNYPKENVTSFQAEVKRFGPFIKAMISAGSPIFIFKNKKLLSAINKRGKKLTREKNVQA